MSFLDRFAPALENAKLVYHKRDAYWMIGFGGLIILGIFFPRISLFFMSFLCALTMMSYGNLKWLLRSEKAKNGSEMTGDEVRIL